MVTTIRKVTRNLTGNDGSMPPTTSAASAPPRPASPLPTAKATAKMRSTSIAEPVGDARVVDRRAQLRAEARADQEELQRGRDRAADHDDEQAIDG